MSSPSVLFALENSLNHTPVKTGQDLWLTSFGAGFAAHSLRLGAV
jgi:alkylresorcinol/alkylpyrone synthase